MLKLFQKRFGEKVFTKDVELNNMSIKSHRNIKRYFSISIEVVTITILILSSYLIFAKIIPNLSLIDSVILGFACGYCILTEIIVLIYRFIFKILDLENL